MNASPRILAVIPARYASTRFPGKPLVNIHGKPMIQHVWERASAAPGLARIIVATDDPRIEAAAREFGADVRMTSPDHPSGTDRMWEVARDLPEYDWILNVQGDEPFMDPAHLDASIAAIDRFPQADVITLVCPLRDVSDWLDPNIVKSVISDSGQALYFSRAPVPYHRDAPDVPERVFRHVGLYMYRRSALERFTQLPPSPLETIEKLEQLRVLEAGMRLFAAEVSQAAISIDTPADLERVLGAPTS